MVPISGLDEVGRNMMLIVYGDERIVVDCGIGFPRGIDRDGETEQYLPDVAAIGRDPISMVVLTHGHDDHVAALRHLIRSGAPIGRLVALPFTMQLALAKLPEGSHVPPVHQARPGEVVRAGAFAVEFIRMAHSIPDAAALAISTPVGTIVVTGDYKLDTTTARADRRTDVQRLRAVGDAGVLALLADSTNALLPGRTPSEDVTAEPILDLVRAQTGRVIVTAFASNIDRIDHAIAAADATGRNVALLGRSMRRNAEIAWRLDHLRRPKRALLGQREIRGSEPRRTLVVSTGSQGEKNAVLARAARNHHPFLALHDGDTVMFASRPVPGNEFEVEALQLALHERGARVLTRDDGLIHVSGHARADEITDLIELLRPRYVIPVHGERDMLEAHGAIAEGCGVPSDRVCIAHPGDVIEITETEIGVIDHLAVRRIAANGDGEPIDLQPIPAI